MLSCLPEIVLTFWTWESLLWWVTWMRKKHKTLAVLIVLRGLFCLVSFDHFQFFRSLISAHVVLESPGIILFTHPPGHAFRKCDIWLPSTHPKEIAQLIQLGLISIPSTLTLHPFWKLKPLNLYLVHEYKIMKIKVLPGVYKSHVHLLLYEWEEIKLHTSSSPDMSKMGLHTLHLNKMAHSWPSLAYTK